MGISLAWSTGYNGAAASVDNRVSDMPTVADGVHDVIASHVNTLADIAVELETEQAALITTVAAHTATLASMAPLTVRELDAAPSVSAVNTLEFPNGSLTSMGAGVVRVGFLDVSPSNVIYVSSSGGDNATGTRGDPRKPFATFLAALAATGIATGDIIQLSPGAHPVPVAPTMPGGVTELTIRGYGRGVTFLNGDTNIDVIRTTGAAVFSRLVIEDCTITSKGTGVPVSLVSTTGGFFTAGLELSRVYLDAGAALVITRATILRLIDVFCTGTVTITTSGASLTEDGHHSLIDGLTILAGYSLVTSWDDDDVNKPNTRRALRFRNTWIKGGVTLSKQSEVIFEKSCVIEGQMGSASPAILTQAVSGAVPSITFHGKGDIQFTNPNFLPDSANAATYNFDGIHLKTGAKLNLERAAVVNGRSTVTAHGLVCTGVEGVTARAGVDIYCRSICTPLFATIGSGTVTSAAATDTVPGLVELATTAEVFTGTDTARALTPKGLADALQPAGNTQAAGYALAAVDIGAVVFATGAGAQAFTLPTLAASLITNRMLILTVQQTGAATAVTITPGAASQIDGAGVGVAYVLGAGRKRVSLFSYDGLAWFSGA